MVEQQRKIIELLFQHNTELLEWSGSSTSDLKDKFQVAEANRYCSSAQKLETYHGLLWSNLRTQKLLFHDDTDNVRYTLDHLGCCPCHTHGDMQKLTVINTNTQGQDWQKNNKPCLNNLDLFVAEIQKM